MKKLMFVIPQLSGGGAERVTAVLAGEISCMDGYEVHLVTYRRDSERDYPVAEDVVWHCMDIKFSGIRVLVEKLRFFRNIIARIKPDYVVSLGGAGVIALLALSMMGLDIPLILSERNDP